VKLYFADRDLDQLSISGARRILFSYYYYSSERFIVLREKYFKNGVEVFADSGGFTAMAQGVNIDIGKYCSWLQENMAHFNAYANLDVIGNQVLTRRNQDIMEESGLSPVPVFHIGSSFRELRRLCEKYEYIAIGGMVPYMKRVRSIWKLLSEVFTIAEGKKLHGFGCTNLKVLLGYPWYSVDSATWLVGFKFGEVPIFDKSTFTVKRISAGDWNEWRKNRRIVERLGFNWREVASRRELDKTTLLGLCRASFEEIEECLTAKWAQ